MPWPSITLLFGIAVAAIGARLLAKSVRLCRGLTHRHLHEHPGAQPHSHPHHHGDGDEHGHVHPARAAAYGLLVAACAISVFGAWRIAAGFAQLGISASVPLITAIALAAIVGYALAHHGHEHAHTHAGAHPR